MIIRASSEFEKGMNNKCSFTFHQQDIIFYRYISVLFFWHNHNRLFIGTDALNLPLRIRNAEINEIHSQNRLVSGEKMQFFLHILSSRSFFDFISHPDIYYKSNKYMEYQLEKAVIELINKTLPL